MKSITTYITEKMIYNKSTVNKTKYNYFPKTKEELKQIIKDRIEIEGPACNLNDIDVSEITDMHNLFFHSKFNGDISKWNVSNVTDMSQMFEGSDFNGNISKWDVSKVISMEKMFKDTDFNGDLSYWILNKNCDTELMFDNCALDDQSKKWPCRFR